MPEERQPIEDSAGGFAPAPPVAEEPGGFATDAAATRTSGKAIASLVCGIISLLIAGILLGVVAVVLGAVARKEIAADPGVKGSGMALAGMICGGIGFVLAVILLASGGYGIVAG